MMVFGMIKKKKYINYKGNGEHSVNELEKIIEQREEELHLIKSGDVVKNNDLLHNVRKRFITAANEITSEGLECGLEDLSIEDRYESMQYGFDQCKERVEEVILNV